MAYKGRRRELIITAVLYLLGGLITGCAPGLGVLLVGRLLYGIGIGMVSFFSVFCSF
jgi:predicted MFS family arabinose efflux permease